MSDSSHAEAAAEAPAQLVVTRYDPERAPDAAAWLAMSKEERQRHVRMAHLAIEGQLRGHALQLHAGPPMRIRGSAWVSMCQASSE